MIVPLNWNRWCHLACAQAPLPLPHVFWQDKSLQNPSPALNFKRGILLKRFRHLPPKFHFHVEIGQENLQAGEGVCKDLSCQKACVGEGGKLECKLHDVTGTGSTVWSCCESDLKKTLLKTLKFSNCRESIWKQIRPSCRKNLFTLFCVCLVSWKQRNLEIRANIQIAFKMFGQRVATLVNVICKAKNFFAEREKV